MPYRIIPATFPPLPWPKLVLNLAALEICEVELTWVGGYIFYIRLPLLSISNVSGFAFTD